MVSTHNTSWPRWSSEGYLSPIHSQLAPIRAGLDVIVLSRKEG